MRNLTANGEIFRQNLMEQLHHFPVSDRYTLLFCLSETGDLLTFAHAVFIYRDAQQQSVRLLKREWNTRDNGFVFAPGVYDTNRLGFIDAHKTPVNGADFEEMLTRHIDPPGPHDKILLDGVRYRLHMVNGPLASTMNWQLPEQLKGHLKTLVEKIMEAAGPFQH